MKKQATLTILCAAVISLTEAAAQASSYQVTIASGGEEYCSYCFSSASIQNVFANPPAGIYVDVWNGASQSWVVESYAAPKGGGSPVWTPGTTVLTPGQGFAIQNNTGTSQTFTVQGTPLTSSSYTISFPSSQGKYLVGAAYAPGSGNNFLCCAYYGQYTTPCLGYDPSVNDVVYILESGSWIEFTYTTNTENGIPCPWYDSNTGMYQGSNWSMQLGWPNGDFLNDWGQAVWIYPVGGTSSWTQYPSGVTCGSH